MARGNVDVRRKLRAYYVSSVIWSHSSLPCFDNSLHSHGKTLEGLSQNSSFRTSLVYSRPLLVFEMTKQVELSIRCVVKGYHECPFKWILGKHFTHSRREENVGMRSKLLMIGGSSATFKSSLLVLFGPYLLCYIAVLILEDALSVQKDNASSTLLH